jgi:hypothetical protein
MWAGLAGGVTMMVAGWLVPTELGSMLTGYGLLFVLAAAYLGAGLAIRDRVRAAISTRRAHVEAPSLMGRRVF